MKTTRQKTLLSFVVMLLINFSSAALSKTISAKFNVPTASDISVNKVSTGYSWIAKTVAMITEGKGRGNILSVRWISGSPNLNKASKFFSSTIYENMGRGMNYPVVMSFFSDSKADEFWNNLAGCVMLTATEMNSLIPGYHLDKCQHTPREFKENVATFYCSFTN